MKTFIKNLKKQNFNFFFFLNNLIYSNFQIQILKISFKLTINFRKSKESIYVQCFICNTQYKMDKFDLILEQLVHQQSIFHLIVQFWLLGKLFWCLGHQLFFLFLLSILINCFIIMKINCENVKLKKVKECIPRVKWDW